MRSIKSRTPIHENVYDDLETEKLKSKIMAIIDKSVRNLKKKEFLGDSINVALKKSVDKHIEEGKLKIAIEHQVKVDDLNRIARYRRADKSEIESQLDAIEKEISDLEEDYKLLEKLYKESSLLKSE